MDQVLTLDLQEWVRKGKINLVGATIQYLSPQVSSPLFYSLMGLGWVFISVFTTLIILKSGVDLLDLRFLWFMFCMPVSPPVYLSSMMSMQTTDCVFLVGAWQGVLLLCVFAGHRTHLRHGGARPSSLSLSVLYSGVHSCSVPNVLCRIAKIGWRLCSARSSRVCAGDRPRLRESPAELCLTSRSVWARVKQHAHMPLWMFVLPQ